MEHFLISFLKKFKSVSSIHLLHQISCPGYVPTTFQYNIMESTLTIIRFLRLQQAIFKNFLFHILEIFTDRRTIVAQIQLINMPIQSIVQVFIKSYSKNFKFCRQSVTKIMRLATAPPSFDVDCKFGCSFFAGAAQYGFTGFTQH